MTDYSKPSDSRLINWLNAGLTETKRRYLLTGIQQEKRLFVGVITEGLRSASHGIWIALIALPRTIQKPQSI